eukprot:365123-Chlamydomonas_euryale.AAC.13
MAMGGTLTKHTHVLHGKSACASVLGRPGICHADTGAAYACSARPGSMHMCHTLLLHVHALRGR